MGVAGSGGWDEMTNDNEIILINDDCFNIFENYHLQANLIFADMPYNTTACNWDDEIDLKLLWKFYKSICPNGTIVLFGAMPFTSKLIYSNWENYKFRWIWIKNQATNFYHAKRQPLRNAEDLAVFSFGNALYNPQKTQGHKPTQAAKGKSKGKLWMGDNIRNYPGGLTERFPLSTIYFNIVPRNKRIHETQKPIDLCEYIIKTHSNPGDVILDNFMGVGSSGIAAINLGRKYIGIEKEFKHYKNAEKRIIKAINKNNEIKID